MSDKRARGWCDNCGAPKYTLARAKAGNIKLECPECGSHLKPLDKLTEEERAMVQMQDWFAEVCREGKNGPSPMAAAEELGCSRSMIDRLIGRDILEKSEFTFKDRKVVIVSRRSLNKAKENRTRTGNWTGHPVCRGA